MRSRAVWAAFVVAILLRVGWIVIASESPLPWVDSDEYLIRVNALLQRQPLALAFSDPPFGVLRPPLYIVLVALAVHSGVSMFWLLVIQAVVASTIVFGVYRLSLEIGGRRPGIIGAWLAACWPQWVTSAATTGAEHIDTPLVCAGLILTVIAYRRASGRHAAGAGVLFALAALARSASFYLAPVMAAIVATRHRAAGAIMVAALLAVTAPYIVVISRSAQKLVLIEDLLEWNWAVERTGAPVGASAQPGVTDLPSTMAVVVARDGAGAVVWSAFGRLKNVLFSEDFWESPLRQQAPASLLRWWSPVVATFLIGLYASGLIGIWHAADRNGVLLLVAWVALHCLVVLVSPAIESRHRTPFEPALMALAAAGLARLYLGVRASGIGGAGRLAQW